MGEWLHSEYTLTCPARFWVFLGLQDRQGLPGFLQALMQEHMHQRMLGQMRQHFLHMELVLWLLLGKQGIAYRAGQR